MVTNHSLEVSVETAPVVHQTVIATA